MRTPPHLRTRTTTHTHTAMPIRPWFRGAGCCSRRASRSTGSWAWRSPFRSCAICFAPWRKDSSYNSWVSLGSANDFPTGETRLAFYKNPYTRGWDGATDNVACYVRRESADQFQRLRHQLRAPGLPGALVSAVAAVHVSLPRRRLLRRRLARLGSARARPLYLRLEDRLGQVAD